MTLTGCGQAAATSETEKNATAAEIAALESLAGQEFEMPGMSSSGESSSIRTMTTALPSSVTINGTAYPVSESGSLVYNSSTYTVDRNDASGISFESIISSSAGGSSSKVIELFYPASTVQGEALFTRSSTSDMSGAWSFSMTGSALMQYSTAEGDTASIAFSPLTIEGSGQAQTELSNSVTATIVITANDKTFAGEFKTTTNIEKDNMTIMVYNESKSRLVGEITIADGVMTVTIYENGTPRQLTVSKVSQTKTPTHFFGLVRL